MSDFLNGYSVVRKAGLYGVTNSLNHLVVPLNYTDVSFMFIGSWHMATYIHIIKYPRREIMFRSEMQMELGLLI